MGELILCKQNIAGMPYYLEDMAWNIYTIEELCYCIAQNTELVATDFPDEELITWLDEELGMEELAQQLHQGRQDGLPAAGQVERILKSCDFCSREQTRQVLLQLAELEDKSELECGKIRADRHLKAEKYVCAIQEYQRILACEELKLESAELVGSICHNLGVAYAFMLQYDAASKYFLQAFSYNNNPDSMRQYYLARQCCANQEHREEDIPEEWYDAVRFDLQQAIAEMKNEPVPNYTEQDITEWKRAYRRYSGLS